MGSHRALYALLFSGCATTGALGVDHQPSQHGRVTLAPVAADDTRQVVPQAIDPRLPSADRMARTIEAQLGLEASVEVELCVSPAGRVVEAKLARSSTLPAFDEAVMTDVQRWQFEAQPGPDTVRTCEQATILYRPHR